MMRREVYPALILALLISAVPPLGAAGPPAKDLYEKAMGMEEELKNSESVKSSPAAWKKTVEAFRRVYYTYPSSGYCDNALFHVGNLYAAMGERFQDPLYYHRACSTYQFLIEQYPSSSLVVDAMVDFIRISRDLLRQSGEADAMLRQLKARAPKVAATMEQRVAPSSAPGSPPATLTAVRSYTGADYTRIVLDFDGEVSFVRNRLSDPDRLYFDFDNTVAARELLANGHPVDDSFLKQVRVGQYTPRKARVVLDLKSIQNYDVFSLYHPYRVVVDIQGKKSPTPVSPVPAVQTPDSREPAAQPEQVEQPAQTAVSTPVQVAEPPEMASANATGGYSLARQLGLKVRRIVLDPGHGGHDPGAMHNGLREKDITLDVAKRLRTILERDYGFDVLMTREDDRYLALEERTAFANSRNADLFLSIHVNSSRNGRLQGIETYYLNFATSTAAMEVAARENAIAEKNMGELQKLTSAILLNNKVEESREFAGLIQTTLVSQLRKPYAVTSLGVKHAPFYVLIGAQMPSILAEICFLSNRKESEMLALPEYRQSVARALAAGVRNYIGTLADSRTARKLPAAP